MERELKHGMVGRWPLETSVAPLRGAWIETLIGIAIEIIKRSLHYVERELKQCESINTKSGFSSLHYVERELKHNDRRCKRWMGKRRSITWSVNWNIFRFPEESGSKSRSITWSVNWNTNGDFTPHGDEVAPLRGAWIETLNHQLLADQVLSLHYVERELKRSMKFI